eukprot:SM000202S05910  [mRNA]  locus=s202:95943:98538:- [translate_table: standard]
MLRSHIDGEQLHQEHVKMHGNHVSICCYKTCEEEKQRLIMELKDQDINLAALESELQWAMKCKLNSELALAEHLQVTQPRVTALSEGQGAVASRLIAITGDFHSHAREHAEEKVTEVESQLERLTETFESLAATYNNVTQHLQRAQVEVHEVSSSRAANPEESAGWTPPSDAIRIHESKTSIVDTAALQLKMMGMAMAAAAVLLKGASGGGLPSDAQSQFTSNAGAIHLGSTGAEKYVVSQHVEKPGLKRCSSLGKEGLHVTKDHGQRARADYPPVHGPSPAPAFVQPCTTPPQTGGEPSAEHERRQEGSRARLRVRSKSHRGDRNSTRRQRQIAQNMYEKSTIAWCAYT